MNGFASLAKILDKLPAEVGYFHAIGELNRFFLPFTLRETNTS